MYEERENTADTAGVDAMASYPQLEPALAAASAFDDPTGGAQDKGLFLWINATRHWMVAALDHLSVREEECPVCVACAASCRPAPGLPSFIDVTLDVRVQRL